MSVVRTILRIARVCSRHTDLLAGLQEEKTFIQRLLEELDHPLLTFHLQPIQTLSWRERFSIIETRQGDAYPCLAQPYSLGGEAEGRLVERLDRVSEGDVLLIEYPEDVDDAKFVLIDAISRGVSGVIFVDRYDCFRRIVVSSRRDYTWSLSSPINVPVISVSRRVGEKLLRHVGERVRVESEVEYLHRIGYNVEVTVHEGERYLYIVAHHDHWLNCMLDNAMGVGVAAMLTRELADQSPRGDIGVKTVFFTAEEFGIPNYASLYWAWGSRCYVNFLKSRDLLSTVYFVINLDVIGKRVDLYGAEDVLKNLRELAQPDRAKLTVPYYDSLNFELEGIPTVTLSCIEKIRDIYHSTREDEEHVDLEAVEETYRLCREIIKLLTSRGFNYMLYLEKISKQLSELGIPFKHRTHSVDKIPEIYREVKSLLSRFLVEYRVNSIELRYADNILSYIKTLSLNSKDLVKVEELGTGRTIYLRDHVSELTKGMLLTLQEEIKYHLLR